VSILLRSIPSYDEQAIPFLVQSQNSTTRYKPILKTSSYLFLVPSLTSDLVSKLMGSPGGCRTEQDPLMGALLGHYADAGKCCDPSSWVNTHTHTHTTTLAHTNTHTHTHTHLSTRA
jgi:hypothetical protein